ncbi:MAG TPA: flagellin [Stellaceae bacterium]|nr:flagellin [Stellaceae bacterium]
MIAGAINTNVDALYALNSLNTTTNKTDTLEQQLSSGLAINSPADNPAGYIAAQGFTTQLGGVNQAISNVNQAVSLVQTADGAVQQQINILQQLRTIADQAANGANTTSQLASLQQVVSQLQTQVTTISQQAQFNNQNLLDGTFQGVQFQVGPNDGQTIQISIGNTAANQLGVYQTSPNTAAGIFKTNGVGTGGVGDNTGASYIITSGSAGGFTAGSIGVSGSAGGASVAVTQPEAASDIATAVNAVTAKTDVSAVADTSAAFTVTSGSFSFTLGDVNAAGSNTVNISATVTGAVNASSLSGLVNSINQQSGQTGITATVNSNNQLVLTQGQGDNIQVTSFSGTGGATLAAGGTSPVTLGGAVTSATVQGVVTMQSADSFALSAAASDIGLTTSSNLSKLSAATVSTVGHANAALNVVDFAIQQLENVGGQLGATQQRLQASVSNLETTQVNMTSALSTIQDANIPSVTTQLTQEQILQQAGVDALAKSGQLQQSFLRLLQQ